MHDSVVHVAMTTDADRWNCLLRVHFCWLRNISQGYVVGVSFGLAMRMRSGTFLSNVTHVKVQHGRKDHAKKPSTKPQWIDPNICSHSTGATVLVCFWFFFLLRLHCSILSAQQSCNQPGLVQRAWWFCFFSHQPLSYFFVAIHVSLHVVIDTSDEFFKQPGMMSIDGPRCIPCKIIGLYLA